MSRKAKKIAHLLTGRLGTGHSKTTTTGYSTAGLVSMPSSDQVIVVGRNLGRDMMLEKWVDVLVRRGGLPGLDELLDELVMERAGDENKR
jgi:hypothetical protein